MKSFLVQLVTHCPLSSLCGSLWRVSLHPVCSLSKYFRHICCLCSILIYSTVAHKVSVAIY